MMYRTGGVASGSSLIAGGVVSVLAWCLIGSAVPARSQIANLAVSPPADQRHFPSIRVDSDLVLIPVTVVDGDDRVVPGLDKDCFRLYDDKVEQAITHFAMEDAPVSIAFLVDSSSSMVDKIRNARLAVSTLLDLANPKDEFLLAQFSDRPDLLSGLTEDGEEIRRRMRFIFPGGRTALLDAILLALQELQESHNSRKALVIVSDGGDNLSRHTLGEVKKRVRESDVQIYALGIFDPWDSSSRSMEEIAGPALLHSIAKQSGGKLFTVRDASELSEIASRIGMALRTQYLLGYAPENGRRDGKYHKINVKLIRPKGAPKLHASWRQGYFAPAD